MNTILIIIIKFYILTYFFVDKSLFLYKIPFLVDCHKLTLNK